MSRCSTAAARALPPRALSLRLWCFTVRWGSLCSQGAHRGWRSSSQLCVTAFPLLCLVDLVEGGGSSLALARVKFTCTAGVRVPRAMVGGVTIWLPPRKAPGFLLLQLQKLASSFRNWHACPLLLTFQNTRIRVLWLPVYPSLTTGSLRAGWARLTCLPGRHTAGACPRRASGSVPTPSVASLSLVA